MTTWVRSRGTWGSGTQWNNTLVTVPAGHTLLRIHAGFTFQVRASAMTDPNQVSQYAMVAGIYSTLQAGGTIIYPADSPADAAPPTQRWLWWEQITTLPRPSGWSVPAAYWLWAGGPARGYIECEAMVKASAAAVNINLSGQVEGTLGVGWAKSAVWWASCLYS